MPYTGHLHSTHTTPYTTQVVGNGSRMGLGGLKIKSHAKRCITCDKQAPSSNEIELIFRMYASRIAQKRMNMIAIDTKDVYITICPLWCLKMIPIDTKDVYVTICPLWCLKHLLPIDTKDVYVTICNNVHSLQLTSDNNGCPVMIPKVRQTISNRLKCSIKIFPMSPLR